MTGIDNYLGTFIVSGFKFVGDLPEVRCCMGGQHEPPRYASKNVERTGLLTIA